MWWDEVRSAGEKIGSKGISTISLALDLYWNFKHRALQGTLVTHNDDAREFFRATLENYMSYLPREYKVPIKAHNRTQLIFKNNSARFFLL